MSMMAMRAICKRAAGLVLVVLPLANAVAGEARLVALSRIDASIAQDIRYARAENFTGKRVPGYHAGVCWLLPQVARALAAVQADLVRQRPDLSLMVLDCYRPVRAVTAFMAWASATKGDDSSSRFYHPNVARRALVARGYIGRTSSHSKGVAVDLTLVRRAVGSAAVAQRDQAGVTCVEAGAIGAEGAALDMGTTFDCFDPKSHTDAAGLTTEQRAVRQLLRRVMERHGFKNYSREWWHYTFGASDDGPTFDVPVTAGEPVVR